MAAAQHSLSRRTHKAIAEGSAVSVHCGAAAQHSLSRRAHQALVAGREREVASTKLPPSEVGGAPSVARGLARVKVGGDGRRPSGANVARQQIWRALRRLLLGLDAEHR